MIRRSQLPPWLGALPRVLVCAALTAVLASCSSGSSEDSSEPSDDAASDRPTASASPSPSPSPTLPEPADGENTQACADGTCEVRVTGPIVVLVPERIGVGSLEVTSIEEDRISMTALLTGTSMSTDSPQGVCSFGVTTSSDYGPGHVDISCPAGHEAVVNGLSVEVAGIVDGAAVLRFRPVD
ncbi:hypothetical protein [Streptomyces sp. B6B3]|uniref:hypothetical protein n=1 Tax=Streptomyces sp. B6B3 TaxID=3153570 RepID=UPI00325F6B6B